MATSKQTLLRSLFSVQPPAFHGHRTWDRMQTYLVVVAVGREYPRNPITDRQVMMKRRPT